MTQECGTEGGPLREERGMLMSTVQTEYGSLRVQRDTGSAIEVLRASAVLTQLPNATLLRRLGFRRFELAGRSAGPRAFVMRAFAAPDVDAVLSSDFFGAHVVCLDPARGRVAFR